MDGGKGFVVQQCVYFILISRKSEIYLGEGVGVEVFLYWLLPEFTIVCITTKNLKQANPSDLINLSLVYDMIPNNMD